MNNNELMHYGVPGMKWGVIRNRNKGSGSTAGKHKRQTYRQKIESSMRDYDKQHPERNQKDNYTIAIRNAQRKEQERAMKTQFASMALLPVFGIGATLAVANLYVANKRNNTLSEIMDEHNIEVAKRVINM